MKKFKFILVALTLSLFALNSCQDNSPVTPDQPEATESIALRTVLNKLKVANNITGRVANTARTTADNEDDFCFDFVYPFQLEYNTGAQVTVENFEGLIQILVNETSDLYIVGIVFPFDIVLTTDGSTVTINSEQDFIEVLQNCQMDVWDDEDIVIDTCFELVYPFDMIDGDGNTVTITSDDALVTFLSNQDPQYYEPQFVYPITVIDSEGEEVIIESLYDFYDLVDDCYDCDCPDVYEPVCVVVDPQYNETIQFDNACEAICEGFSPSDFVNCDGTDDDCDINDLEVTTGDCIGGGFYNITINFEYTTTETFEVFTTSYINLGTYSTADLPVTIDFPASGTEHDMIFVNDAQNPNCWENLEFDAPECAVVDFNFMDYVSSCVDFVYPIEVTYGGETYEVNSYAQLGQYFGSPAQSGELQFPLQIEVIATGEVITINNADELEEAIDENCD